MADIVEVIISAIDKASPVFSQIGSEVSSMASEVESAIDGVDADGLADEFEQVDSAIDNVDASGLNDVDSTVEQLEAEFQEATAEVERLEDALDEAHLNGDDIEADRIADELAEATAKAEQLGNDLNNIKSAGLQRVGAETQENSSRFSRLRQTIVSTFESTKGIVSSFGSTLSNLGSRVTGVTSKFSGLRNSINYAGVGAESAGAHFGFLRDAASMAVGMVGYDLVNGFVESGRAALNARSQFDYFGQRLQKMSGDSKMSATQLQKLKTDVSDLQKEFRKVDMTAVAATAEEIAVKMQLPANKVGDLTRMTAVMSSTFVKEGRSQEDAILAVSDALDGQFKRLQEIGITKDMLMNNGWDGNLENEAGLIDALNKTMKDMGYEETAKDITSLDEAFGALSIAGGQLLADLLIPITPALIEIMEGAMVAADGLSGFISMVQGAVSGMPDWATIGLGVTVLGVAFGIVGTIIMSTYVPGMVASVIATINWIATALGAQVSAITLSGAFGLLATTIWAALAPLLPFIAAAALIVVAVYEIGKAFGWWNDIGGMLSAIQAGLTRLWNAFINHPDVQAAISAISGALSTLWNWITQAGQAISDFFGISTGGDFDIVSALIHNVGDAWNAIKEPIVAVIEIIMTVIEVFSQLASGQMDVQTAVLTVWNSLATNIPVILQFIYSYLLSFVVQLAIYAIQAGLNFVNGILNNVRQLPGRIQSYLLQVLTSIILQTARWVSTGRTKASQLLNGILSYIRQLPSRALSALLGVVTSIVSAGAQWISNARSRATAVVTGVVNILTGLPGKISGALSGVVSAITQPFKSAYDSVVGVVDNIKSKVQEGMNAIANLGGAAGGDLAAGGDIVPLAAGGDMIATDVYGQDFNVSNGEYVIDRGPIEVNEKFTVVLDLINVPAHIDTDTLIRMLRDPAVLRAIVENRDFQSLDAKVKQQIDFKLKRSKGV